MHSRGPFYYFRMFSQSRIISATSSIEAYRNEHKGGEMPSLTLWPLGAADRSIISHHLLLRAGHEHVANWTSQPELLECV